LLPLLFSVFGAAESKRRYAMRLIKCVLINTGVQRIQRKFGLATLTDP